MGNFLLSITAGIISGVIVAAYYRFKDESKISDEGVKEELYQWYQFLSNIHIGLLELMRNNDKTYLRRLLFNKPGKEKLAKEAKQEIIEVIKQLTVMFIDLNTNLNTSDYDREYLMNLETEILKYQQRIMTIREAR